MLRRHVCLLLLLLRAAAVAADDYLWTPVLATTCVNCDVQITVPSWKSLLESKGFSLANLKTCGLGNVTMTIEYPFGNYARTSSVTPTLNWTNSDRVTYSVKDTTAPVLATVGTSVVSIPLSPAAIAAFASDGPSTLTLTNLNSPYVNATYTGFGSISVLAANISPSCISSGNGNNNIKQTLLEPTKFKIGRNFTGLSLALVGNISAPSTVIGSSTDVTITLTSTGVVPPNTVFQLLSALELSHFNDAFTSLAGVRIRTPSGVHNCVTYAGASRFTGALNGTFFTTPELALVPQNTPFTLTFLNVSNPNATLHALRVLQMNAYYVNPTIMVNVLGSTMGDAKYFTVLQATFDGANNAYDLASTLLFGICLVISLYIVYKHGLAFTSSTVWTDLVSISVVLAYVCSFSAYFLWLFRPSSIFVYLTAGQYLFTTVMIVSLCFHWASVLRLQLFRKLTFKSPVVFMYIAINMVLLGGLLGCLVVFSGQLECVYTKDVTGALRYSALLDASSPPPANGYQVLDSLAMCSMNGYYVLLALGFMVFTLFLVLLGGAVMCRGRSLMLSEAQPVDDRMNMRKSLTIFYCIIASTVVIFIISDIIYIASYIVAKPIERDFKDFGKTPGPSTNDQRVSTFVWYLFTIWLPQIGPPLLLLFLHYDPKREDDMLDEIAVLSAPKDAYRSTNLGSLDTPESEAVGDLNVFKSHRDHGRRYVERAGTFLEDASNKLHVIVKLKVPEGALPSVCYMSLSYCTLRTAHRGEQNNREVLLHTLTKDAQWKPVGETERLTEAIPGDADQFRSSTLGMSNVPFVAVLSIPVAGLAPNTLVRFLLHASLPSEDDDDDDDDDEAVTLPPILEFVTTPQAVMDAASHGQALVVSVADAHDVTCHELVVRKPSSAFAYVNPKLYHDTKLSVTTVSMGEASAGDEPSHQNMGNIIRYFQYEAEVGDGGLVVEELKESRFANNIPRQLLDLLAAERADDVEVASKDVAAFLSQKKPTKDGGFYNQILQTIQDEGDATVVRMWLEDRLERRKEYLSHLRKNIQLLVQRDNQKRYFKASVEKKSQDLKFVPINLHVEDYLVGPTNAFVNEEKRKSSRDVSIYEFTTVGAMAAHCYKFKSGGLTSMVNKVLKLQAQVAESDGPRWSDEVRALDDLKWDVKLRMDVCFSQALSALVASFVRKIELALQSPDMQKGESILNQLSRIGFLFQVESLLSTHGNEIGMLEDMAAAVERLSTVAFVLLDVRDKPSGRFSFRKRLTIKDLHSSSDHSMNDDVVVKVQVAEKPKSLSSSNIKYIVSVHVNCTDTPLPGRLLDGGEIPVTPLLFTQGINEMQSIANSTERAKTELQDAINLRNLKPLEEFCSQYMRSHQSWSLQRAAKRKGSDGDGLSETEITRQLQTLRLAIEESASSLVKTKRPDILTKSSDLCRGLGGGRVTICKSAKDRTAMSVTLEQVRILHRFHGLPAYKVASTVAVMRTHGVRIENALKNTGKRQFAFNKLQRYAMPEDYRCPESAGGTGNIS
ncbi:hypothetical protein SDRG_07802 [Saprolegnia diclina VS20]|uniref:Inositol-3,4-bisphosphate 4-phosphatase n=1 Tax=Saprolegnia diclina (strain VS20) TaxID=1156394 RepID=T0RPT0_SAPDV|nr:hypothetical protein SDRG_07802 [Saprolegnia diclina VS20]EQC34473.1 hypothetical protein SDRG_07802 [Saprolegnia diclina VS20]|eukprot:XP_008611879.1 hypothetical protein SDRG_07802 [Saprolegnia diclina VS20]